MNLGLRRTRVRGLGFEPIITHLKSHMIIVCANQMHLVCISNYVTTTHGYEPFRLRIPRDIDTRRINQRIVGSQNEEHIS